MESPSKKDYEPITLYVGHEQSRRPYTVTADIFDVAQQRGVSKLQTLINLPCIADILLVRYANCTDY